MVGIQKTGGTRKTIDEGKRWVSEALEKIKSVPQVDMGLDELDELTIGTICGGSDATSGISANPAVGRAFDTLVAKGSVCIFEETGEMIGLENIMRTRAITPALAEKLQKSVEKAAIYYTKMGHGSFAPGNADGGLTTIEEKSMGAYSKSGNSPITGLIKPGDIPSRGGLYLWMLYQMVSPYLVFLI